jgi:hypothetical protein
MDGKLTEQRGLIKPSSTLPDCRPTGRDLDEMGVNAMSKVPDSLQLTGYPVSGIDLGDLN